MKKILILFTIILFCTSVYSQNGHQFKLIKEKEVESSSVSARNPWLIGAKLSFAVRDLDGNLEDNFIFSGKAATVLLEESNYGIPLYTSVGLGNQDIISTESGFNVGVYPWYDVYSNETFSLVAHGGLGYKVVPGEDEALDAVTQIRALAGLEVIFPTEVHPITLSVSPVFLDNNILPNSTMLESTLVFPLSTGVGVLAEHQLSLDSDFGSVFRMGVIMIDSL